MGTALVKRGTPGKGKHVGLVADGTGKWISVSQYKREEILLDKILTKCYGELKGVLDQQKRNVK